MSSEQDIAAAKARLLRHVHDLHVAALQLNGGNSGEALVALATTLGCAVAMRASNPEDLEQGLAIANRLVATAAKAAISLGAA